MLFTAGIFDLTIASLSWQDGGKFACQARIVVEARPIRYQLPMGHQRKPLTLPSNASRLMLNLRGRTASPLQHTISKSAVAFVRSQEVNLHVFGESFSYFIAIQF